MEIKLPVTFNNGFYQVEYQGMKASYPKQEGFDLLPEPPSSGFTFFKARTTADKESVLRAIEYVDGGYGTPEWFGEYA